MTSEAVPEWRLIDRLKRAREHAGYDQADLAERIGVSRNTISNYERGMVAPARQILASWALATGVDREWLERGESKRSSSDDLLDEVDRALREVERTLRARRDSNPQPSDWESWTAAA